MNDSGPHIPDNRRERLKLLAELMNTLSESGVVGETTLRQVALDVMAIDYREDEDLLHFTGLHEDFHHD